MTIRPGTHEEGFLQDIVDHPDDPTTRLIYADWLEERDDPRSELIRLQHVERKKTDVECVREQVLGFREETRWKAYFASRNIPLANIWFRGGLPYKISMTAPDFLEHASTVFHTAPIQAVHLSNVDHQLLSFVCCNSVTERLRELDLHGCNLGNWGAYTLAHGPHLANLRTLNVASTGMNSDSIRHLTTSPILTAIEHVNLSGMPLGNYYAMSAIVASPWKLNTLNLSLANLTQYALELLGESNKLDGIEELDISRNYHAAAGVPDLLRQERTNRLRSLNLAGNPIRPQGAFFIAGCESLRQLERLDLQRCDIGLFGARRIFGTLNLPSLRYLNLSNNLGVPTIGPDAEDFHLQAEKRGIKLKLNLQLGES